MVLDYAKGDTSELSLGVFRNIHESNVRWIKCIVLLCLQARVLSQENRNIYLNLFNPSLFIDPLW